MRAMGASLAGLLLVLTLPAAALDQDCLDLEELEQAAAQSEAQQAAEIQKVEEKKKARRRPSGWFQFRSRPSLRFGNWLRVDFRVKVQNDHRTYDPKIATDEGDYELNRLRVGVEGRFLNHFEFEVEREIKEQFTQVFDLQREQTPNVWRDVFINFRYLRDFQIKGGKFKIPFGMEQLTGPTNLDFINRARISNELTPGRDLGIMAHGRFFQRGLSYEAGIFRHDGENAQIREVVNELGDEERFYTGVRSFAGRVTGMPLRLIKMPGPLRTVELGGAFVLTKVPPGLKGLRGRGLAGETYYRHIFVHGQRLRLGAELNWASGPFSVKSEFIHVSEERQGQGIRGEDLPNAISRGWYVTGTWVVTGQRNETRDEPSRRAFVLLGRGLGAVEIAARYESLRHGSAEHPGRPSRASRAANILGNSERLWTFGANWYMHRWTKVQFNAVRERFEDAQRVPLLGVTDPYWTRMVRVQFVF